MSSSPPSSSSLPISPVDLRLNRDVLSLILDHYFHLLDPQTPQSTVPSLDPAAANLLLVSKGFSELVLPRLWNTIVLRSPQDWTLLFGAAGGALSGEERAARRELVKTLFIDLDVSCPLKKPSEPTADRLLAELSFQQLPSLKTMVLLSSQSGLGSKVLWSDAVAGIEHRVGRSVDGGTDEEGGPFTQQAARRLRITIEVTEGIQSEIEYDRTDLLSSARDYVVRADICDPIFNRVAASSSFFFDPPFLPVLRLKGATLELRPGRQVNVGEEKGRGYRSLQEDVLPRLRRCLVLKDLPRVLLVGFPPSWIEEFAKWRDSRDAPFEGSRGCDWVLEDGSKVSFLPDEGSSSADEPGDGFENLLAGASSMNLTS